MNKQLLIVLFALLCINHAIAQPIPKVIVPPFGDAYCRTVRELEAGRLDIDYKTFRENFLASRQFKIATGRRKEQDSLEKRMYAELERSNYTAVIRTTKQLLSIDYTNMLAHKILRQTYTLAGDTVTARKYHDIQFGLLKSITKGGNGKTCATAWPVIQAAETTFILKMLEAKVERQRPAGPDGGCDVVDVLVDGKRKTYYFELLRPGRSGQPVKAP